MIPNPEQARAIYEGRQHLEPNRLGKYQEEDLAYIRSHLRHSPQIEVAVELGVYFGRSSIAIASVLPDTGLLYSVDEGFPKAENPPRASSSTT